MEQEEVKVECLSDYKELFNDHITGKDITKISEETGLSKSTIYTYLNGGVPDTFNAKISEQTILKCCKEILIKRGQLLLDSLTKIV